VSEGPGDRSAVTGSSLTLPIVEGSSTKSTAGAAQRYAQPSLFSDRSEASS
jgi:hypothetical protein